MMKKFYVYKTTNTINGNTYIGFHGSEDIENDPYMGSGVFLKQAFQKYGKEVFEREILYEYDNVKDAIVKERELVDEDFVRRRDTYNIALGGIAQVGEFHPNYQREFTAEHCKNIGAGVRNYYDNLDEYPPELREVRREVRRKQLEKTGGAIPDEIRMKISQTLTGKYCGEKHPMYGRTHTAEARAAISAARTGRPGNRTGQSPSEETRSAIRNTLKNKPRAKCPHCGLESYEYTLKRNHFDKCKERKDA